VPPRSVPGIARARFQPALADARALLDNAGATAVPRAQTRENEMRIQIGTLCAAIASVVLGACSSTVVVRPMYFPGFFNPLVTNASCSMKDCSVPFKVIDCAEGKFDVPDVLDITTGPSGQRSITWTISEGNYEFADEKFKYGIFIKGIAGSEFKNVQLTNGKKSLTIDFTKDADVSGAVFYQYALTVRRTDGNKKFCKTLDPWLIS
jgi:hypothetical protein